ncbi:hypothetical protein R1sor_016960 [Riccia sorocarpa]|uniref:Transposase n=1 Tax=Riccia sorocarpa TaxID=122646 RepID=A0ABD3I5G9_9MARC
MCNSCHIRIERRAVQAVPEEGESDEEFEEDESSKSRNLECEYVHLVEEMKDLFEEEESSCGTVIAYCKVTLQEEILREVLRSENEKVVGVVNVKVCIKKKKMELMLTHLCPHPKPEYKGDAVPEAALRRIEEMACTNIRRGDVYRMLCLEGLLDSERIRRAHVNFWMAEKLAKLSGKDRVRKEMLKRWERGLKPIFAVTDKDMGQIGGIEGTFPNTYVQMCLWNAQRAVELRIQLLDSPIRPYDAAAAHAVHNFIDETWIPESLLQRGHICPVDNKKSVLGMFSRHYDMNPLVHRRDGFYLSADDLYKKACKEAYEWCKSKDLVHFWGYLWNQCYCPKKWRRFSRSAKPLLCFSRTTNIAESHWRLLKYNYKYECNRPRLDKLAVDNVVHDWTGEEFEAIDDPPDTADVTDDYLEKFKEKWLKAIGQCMTALRSGRQQQTWAKTGPSMWLC